MTIKERSNVFFDQRGRSVKEPVVNASVCTGYDTVRVVRVIAILTPGMGLERISQAAGVLSFYVDLRLQMQNGKDFRNATQLAKNVHVFPVLRIGKEVVEV
ncbi:hypothetical protein KP509_11G047000 [Ceratopteris richardii]|uniref:Uncharacterized protein n=1 Tax=Ceratopteris richardii TaxID=49495 RepID=A0A8T2TP42_CERRI|nr:hypothetical protein KP509_11G047000 [Ceratopteris richardii]